jgi:cation-dependent mannose-6-phosphate receptor
MQEDAVGAFYRGKHGDFGMGTANSTLSVVDGNPVLYLTDGSPCPNAGNTKMLANTAIRFICEQTRFTAGK